MGKKYKNETLLPSDAEGSDSLHDLKSDKVFRQYANRQLPLSTERTNSTLTPYTGPWTRKEVIHLLRRTTFGLRSADINSLLVLNPSKAVDLLIDSVPDTTPDPPLNNYNAKTKDTTGVLPDQTWVNAEYGDGTINFQRQYSFKAWWISLMLEEKMNIGEKMTLFWHNHFATETQGIGIARSMYIHNSLLRRNVLGNFKTLTKAVTVDVGMLRYLNGDKNTASSPDENYARELQELFTVGTGNPSNYTQGDVEAAAKVLTGWRVNGFTSVFDSKQHSTSDKQFSSFYSNAVIKYQAGSDGALETDALIDMIFKKTEAAKRICRAFYRFFVYYAIDANVESTIIAPMALTLTANNFEVKPVIRELLKSAHFFDALNQGCYIKTPLDFLVGTFKTFDVQVSPAMTVENRYKVYNLIRSYGQFMAQDLGDPPNVAGWPAFHQYPEYYQTWINSDTLPRRLSFTDVMVNTGINVGNANFRIDSVAFAKQCTKPEDPDVLIDFFVELLLALPLSATKKTSLKSILLSNQTSNSYWTVAWNNYIGKQISTDEAILRTRLNPLLLEITRLAEHQLA